MSDEKRQTRLLPFRLRRRAPRADAQDASPDEELRELLRAWESPPASREARVRLLAEFRAAARRAPLWRRALRAELRVPLPLAACAVVALISLLAFAARPSSRPAQPKPDADAQTSAADAQASNISEAAPAVKVVEVPVVRERVVTRVVYVEKKARREAAAESAATGARARDEGARPQGAASSYFTGVDMEDFRPADEMKIKIVRRGKADEK